METGLGSALYCLQLEYLHLYSCSKRTQLKERNKKVVLLQQIWNLSVALQHISNWILILSICISHENHSPCQSDLSHSCLLW